jgi:hypothetical protein
MTRKIKIPNEIQKRRQIAGGESKRLNTRIIRKFYLIVCEGEKTEPHYFEALKKDLPRGVLTTLQIEIKGTGMNTMSLVNEALRLKREYESKTGREIDKIWAVLDRDSFPASDFNNAIHRFKNSPMEFECAWSNESFELWYLLHFNFYNHPISRKDYKSLIEENLRPHLGTKWRYEKNSQEMYKLLHQHGCQKTAIQNARLLSAAYTGKKDYANHNPCTMVYKLVEELLNM